MPMAVVWATRDAETALIAPMVIHAAVSENLTAAGVRALELALLEIFADKFVSFLDVISTALVWTLLSRIFPAFLAHGYIAFGAIKRVVRNHVADEALELAVQLDLAFAAVVLRSADNVFIIYGKFALLLVGCEVEGWIHILDRLVI